MIVSIIVPMFNAVQTIESAIGSGLNQNHVDGVKREIIVVDDRSTDGSYEFVNKFVKPGNLIKLIQITNRIESAGPAAARNLAVSMSQGDYILPLDADDIIRPDFIQKTLPLMQAGVGFVSTEMQYFGIESLVLPIRNVGYEQELHSNTIPVTSLIDREAFLQAGGYQTDVPGFEDWSLWLDILSRGWQMASVQEPLFWYRRRENHFGTTAWDNKIELTRNMRKRHPRFLEGQVDA